MFGIPNCYIEMFGSINSWVQMKLSISAFPNIGIQDFSFSFPNIGIIDFSFSKNWNSGFWLLQTREFRILAFPNIGIVDFSFFKHGKSKNVEV